ncbi:MAG: ArnT family glycosyltransferase [Ardenticatenaceae bacterium]
MSKMEFMVRENLFTKPTANPGEESPSTPQLKKQTAWLLVAGAVLVGAFLRLWQINALGYNSDEAVYAGQGAAIARDPILQEIFPVFRAHPLLFQFVLAVAFSFGTSDILGRLVAVTVGLVTIVFVYRLGNLLYGPICGVIAAFFIAVMPYHVVVTRQVLLDGPMVLCATLALFTMARFAATQQSSWLYAAGASMGLSFLAKETSVVLLGSIYAFLALSPEIRTRIQDLVISVICMAMVIAPFPLALRLAGGGGQSSAGQYIVWQLFRRPNHTWDFYPTTVPLAVGPLLILVGVVGLWLFRHQTSWRERLLLAWIAVPVTFFQLWPVKGFQYLLPAAVPMAILTARALALSLDPSNFPSNLPSSVRNMIKPKMVWGLTVVIALSIFVVSWQRVQTVMSDTFLAGSGGIPGGRESGEWIKKNVPEGAIFMTIGPSMGNIVQFYGNRLAFGLSISPNPLHRNPSYKPINNPDFQLRSGNLQYIVWDSFSANRTTFFSEKLLEYADRYHGRVVHTETVTLTNEDGEEIEKPVIIIYEVRP